MGMGISKVHFRTISIYYVVRTVLFFSTHFVQYVNVCMYMRLGVCIYCTIDCSKIFLFAFQRCPTPSRIGI